MILVFLALRLAVLFSYLDGLYEPEELYRGTIAREIIHGPLMPLWEYLDYKVEYFPGGTLVVGFLAVPFFLLFGETYIALKLVGLLFALGTFILWYVFLERFFNRKTAVLSSLFFIFCVPFYAKTSLITWGAHPEANFFTALSIFVFYGMFSGKDSPYGLITSKPNMGSSLWLGVVCGFGLWFVQTFALTFLFLLLCWYVLDRRFFLKKGFLSFLSGFLIGFSPGIYYGLFYNGSVFEVSGRMPLVNLLSCDLEAILSKLASLLLCELPNSFLFPKIFGLGGAFFSYFYYAFFVISFIGFVWVNRRQFWAIWLRLIYPITLKESPTVSLSKAKEGFLLMYPLLFFIAYSVSGYSVSPAPWDNPELWLDYIGYRYMIPAMPFIMLILALFITRLWRLKWLYGILAGIVLALGIIGNAGIISAHNFGMFFQDKGYSYNIIGDKIGLRITAGLKGYISRFEWLGKDLKTQFYEGLGAGIAWRMRDEGIDKITGFFSSEVKEEYHGCLYRGWGSLFSPEYPEEFEAALTTAQGIPWEHKQYFYEGFGRNMGFFDKPDDISQAFNFIGRVDREYSGSCYAGLGYAIGFELKNEPEYRGILLKRINAEYLPFVYQGLSMGMRER